MLSLTQNELRLLVTVLQESIHAHADNAVEQARQDDAGIFVARGAVIVAGRAIAEREYLMRFISEALHGEEGVEE
jgi:hypothetical protein